MNIKNKKILKMSKIVTVFLKIGAIVSILTIAGAIVAIVTAPSLNPALLSISGIWGSIPLNAGVNEFRAVMTSEMLNSGVVAAIFFIMSFVFRDIALENTPFTKKNSNRLKVISLLAIAFSILIQPLRMLLAYFFIPSVNIHVSINFGYLLFAAMFFCLSLIFEYGTELQIESDETL